MLMLYFDQHVFCMQISHAMEKVLGKKLFNKIMRMSFYGHFVAGENQQEVNVRFFFCLYTALTRHAPCSATSNIANDIHTLLLFNNSQCTRIALMAEW